MLRFQYIEDVFMEFCTRVVDTPLMSTTEQGVIDSLYSVVAADKLLTEKQADYILRLLTKHKTQICNSYFDYSANLLNPAFKNQFRVIDRQRCAWVECDSNHDVLLCCKFPYSFKKQYDCAVLAFSSSLGKWDHDRQIRTVNFYEINQVHAYEFLTANGFNIDSSLQFAIAEIEELWASQDDVIPSAIVRNNTVVFRATTSSAADYFKLNKTENLHKDQFIAKTMGYPMTLSTPVTTAFDKIVSTRSNVFHAATLFKVLEIYMILRCKIAIVLDFNTRNIEWLSNFTDAASLFDIERSKIKVCFRSKESRSDSINDWIHRSGFDGEVSSGDIFIFDKKPAKWIFKDPGVIKIAVSTSAFPPLDPITRNWFYAHSCAIHLTDIAPTIKGNTKIVTL